MSIFKAITLMRLKHCLENRQKVYFVDKSSPVVSNGLRSTHVVTDWSVGGLRGQTVFVARLKLTTP